MDVSDFFNDTVAMTTMYFV